MDARDDFFPDIIYFIRRECTPSWRMDEQTTNIINITYVTRGVAGYVINGEKYDVAAGDLLCLPAGTVRAATTPVDDLMVCYSTDLKLIDAQGEQIPPPFPVIHRVGLHADLINLYNELNFILLNKGPGCNIKARGLFMIILHRFYELVLCKEKPSVTDQRVNKAIRFISENYFRKITTRELAANVSLNPVYFGAIFKQETGMSVNGYLVRIRMNHAKNMLKSGEYTINETAEHCGYSDVLYFRKQFKLVMGYPPSLCFKNLY